MLGLFKKKELPKKMFDLGKTVATVTHLDGRIYFCTTQGFISSFFQPQDDHTHSEKRIKSYLGHASPLEMDCGTLIYKEAINNIKLTTTSHMVEGIDYGNH